MIPGSANPLLLQSAAEAGGYTISRSVRCNSSDSAFCSRAFGSTGSQTTWTWAAWVKRSAFDTTNNLFAVNSGSTFANIRFVNQNIDFAIYNSGSYAGRKITTAVYRDPSAWYHIVSVWDTTNGTAADRMRLYVNGVRVDTFSTSTDPSTSATSVINTNTTHRIATFDGSTEFFNGYLADVHFIDGQALDPTSFGEFDDNGIWQPIAYSGSYGTNGFHLDFSDNSTAAALGTDTSGNDNDWTVNNITANAPGITTANQYFDVVTYTGNGGTQTISGLAFSPDFVWIKSRNNTVGHNLYDAIRGVNKPLITNSTAAEDATNIYGAVSAFNSDGFDVQVGSTDATRANASGYTYVAWCWSAGDSTVSNTDGSITSSVRANPSAGFSIVTYTGNYTANATIGHGLGVTPEFVVIKRRDTTGNWIVYHKGMTSAAYYMYLNSTAAQTNQGGGVNTWAVSSTTITLKELFSDYNANTGTYVAYCFAPVAGYSAFGSYTGNGSTDGPVVVTGFRPKWILIKRSSATENWMIYDTVRSGYIAANDILRADISEAELSNYSAGDIDILSNGFKLRGTWTGINASGSTYVYAAFAGTPAGEEIDALLDVPTNGTETDTGVGGEVRGNYATLNPLDKGSGVSLSNGNLEGSASSDSNYRATISISSGKFYWEVSNFNTAASSTYGIIQANLPVTTLNSGEILYRTDGVVVKEGSSLGTYSSLSSGDILGIACDFDAGEITYYKNNSSELTVSFTSGMSTYGVTPFGRWNNGSGATYNFGQRQFAYASPAGFKALCTANLPAPVVTKPSTVMDVKLYTGNGSTQSITGLGFSPDLVWIKNRTSAYNHGLWDTVRGATNALYSSLTNAEGTESGVSAFNSDGFSVGSALGYNKSSDALVAWTWDAGSSTVTNTDGSITGGAQVRANLSAGFSIVGYTGSGSNATVGHGLGVAPAMIMFKKRSATQNWVVYHSAMGATKALYLDQTVAAVTSSNFFQDTQPTSSVFSLGTGDGVNTISQTFIAYCFAPVESYSAFGSYVGNGSSDGPFVFTGFRSRFILIKGSSFSVSWVIIDTARNTYNIVDQVGLRPNVSDADSTDPVVDIVSNGFKMRKGTASLFNNSGATYVWAAFAENPFALNARAR